MKQRLEQFLSAEHITQSQFADSINVARGGITHILSGRNKPGYDFIVNTIAAYPALNIEWLLTGKGKMYKDSNVPDSESDYGTFDEDSLFKAEIKTKPDPKPEPDPSPVKISATGSTRAKKILVLYEDGTYEEFC